MIRDGRWILGLVWLILAFAVMAPFAAEFFGRRLNCHLAAGYLGEPPVCLWLGIDVFPALWVAGIIGAMALILTVPLLLIFTVLWALTWRGAGSSRA